MTKLSPIYAALDSHQYNRAIKLASALPDNNVLGKALLAHAYSKSGQRYSALTVLNKILSGKFFELKYEVEHSLEAVNERQQQQKGGRSQSTTQPQSAASGNKKGKKGKKKPAPKASPTTAHVSPKNVLDESDLVDQLNCPPSLPEHWESLPPPDREFADATLLATLSVTMQSLQLPLTAYQIYAWAATVEPVEENILTKTFCLGLNVLAAPSKWTKESNIKISTHVLAHMQGVALLYARLIAQAQQQSTPAVFSKFPITLATSWAAQSALWQIQWLPDDPKRSMILPRLAESMAQKLMQQNEEGVLPAEIVLLSLRTLEQQSKWTEMLEILETNEIKDQQPLTSTSEFGVALTTYQILREKARVLSQLQEHGKARDVYENLLKSSPDDWSCWKGHLQCCIDSDQVDVTTSFVDQILTDQSGAKYPLRGPHLMKVELAANRLKRQKTEDSLQAMAAAIQSYAEIFAPRASCAFSDLEGYIEQMMETAVANYNEITESLLKFARTMRESSKSRKESTNNKERQAKLRAYIFAVKLNFKLLVTNVALQDYWLPDGKELVTEWQESLALSASNEGEVSQKELKPGDDLILLAVQQILHQNPGDAGCQVTCAALLESAISHSPDNSYMKMAAIDVYFQLDATSRSWELFQAMNLKHIQLDSCTYTVLPYLMQGGLYNETIEICKTLLRFQASTARDCGNFTGRAMEAGTLSKADEFMVFQRNKMIKSLSVVEAKGLILDAAPLLATAVPSKQLGVKNNAPYSVLKGGLGTLQGIVGGDDDIARATQMVVEAYNPYAALSLVTWASMDGSIHDAEDMSDNRDMDILSNQILHRTKTDDKDSILREALRRGHVHGILIRASLCWDAAKGPKKGKVVKPTEELTKRTQSLLDTVEVVKNFIDTHDLQDGVKGLGSKALIRAVLSICRALSVINAGLPKLENDTMEQREHHANKILENEALDQIKLSKDHVVLSSVKDVCTLLPNYIVPLFAVIKMCANICAVYGWTKKKKNTKKVSGTMAKIAAEFNSFLDAVLVCVEKLPASETATSAVTFEVEDCLNLLDNTMVKDTTEKVLTAQYLTRIRVEPVLQDMIEYLRKFNEASED